MLFCQFWAKEIYLGLMKRRIPNPVKSDSHKNGAEGDEFEAEDGEETKESKEIVD